MNYKIIEDEAKLDEFLALLPDTDDNEVYYLCLFCRHKYAPSFPNTRDSGQLARITARNKVEIKEKIRRMEVPLGSYSRDGVVAPQEGIALYISLNPRSLIKANKWLLVEMAKRAADGNMDFNPMTLATTAVHNAGDRKFFVDFDFDNVDPADHRILIEQALPDQDSYKILKTRGGFHLLVMLDRVKGNKKWYPNVTKLPNCDVRGSDTLTPVAGCVQGGFVPHFVEFNQRIA
jgi:hypothetical protein